MSTLLTLVLWVAFAAAVAGAVHLWRRQLAAGRREDLQALAARRGWSLNVTEARLGRAGTLRLASRGGHAWVAETQAEPGQGASRATIYESEEPAWADGTLVVTPEGARRQVGADLASGLSPIAAPAGLAVLASADPSHRVDLGDLARVLADWQPTAKGDRGQPVVVLSPDGLRLRLGHPIARADHMERFVDLALELTRIIGP